MNTKPIKYAFYSILRIAFEVLNVISRCIKALSFNTIIVAMGLICLVFCCRLLHKTAQKQNQNYISIMDQTIGFRSDGLTDNIWDSSDWSDEYLLSQFKSPSHIYNLPDSISDIDSFTTNAPSVEAILIDLSYDDLIHEENYLTKLYNESGFDTDSYLFHRYLKVAAQEFEEGDFYAANRLINRYFQLSDKFNQGIILETSHNYEYLLRLLLQKRWELSCNRDMAKELMAITSKQMALKEKYNLVSKYAHSSSIFDEYLAYLSGLELIYNRYYTSACRHYIELSSTTTDRLMKEYSAFMAIRSAFWQFDTARTKENKENFQKVFNEYSPIIKAAYFTPDIEYYNNTVNNIDIYDLPS